VLLQMTGLCCSVKNGGRMEPMPLGPVIAIVAGFVFASLLSTAVDLSPMLIAITVMSVFIVCVEIHIRANRNK
jgi:hypothetical protein